MVDEAKKGKGRQFVGPIAHRREHASNALFVTNRSRQRTATACSLQTQAGTAAR